MAKSGAVTAGQEFWQAIGAIFLEQRERQGLTWADLAARADLSAPVFRDNERGLIRTTNSLEVHANVLGLNFLHVMAAVIDQARGKDAISADERALIGSYRKATAVGRVAMRAVAELAGDQPARSTAPARAARPRASRATAAPTGTHRR